jgi:hypothetical protein
VLAPDAELAQEVAGAVDPAAQLAVGQGRVARDEGRLSSVASLIGLA